MVLVQCARCGIVRRVPHWEEGDICTLTKPSEKERFTPYRPTGNRVGEICGGKLKKVATRLPRVGAILKPRDLQRFHVTERQSLHEEEAHTRANGMSPRRWRKNCVVYARGHNAAFALQKIGPDEFQVLELRAVR